MHENELSQLEVKLRKKISILSFDPNEEKRVAKAKKVLLSRINSGGRKMKRTGLSMGDEDIAGKYNPNTKSKPKTDYTKYPLK